MYPVEGMRKIHRFEFLFGVSRQFAWMQDYSRFSDQLVNGKVPGVLAYSIL
jgi:hypothetical protein